MALITLGANSGKGKILQVVSAFTDTDVSNSANSLVDTTLTATITPSSSSNKILVNILQAVGKQSANTWVNIKLFRNSTELLSEPGESIGYTGGSGQNYVGVGFGTSYEDTPSTTSSVTYKTQFRNPPGTGVARAQPDGAVSFITLMEVAG
jgi:hypothetical protein